MRKIVLTYGLIAGAIMSVLMIMTVPFMEKISYTRGLVVGYTTMVLAFLMVFYGVKSYRDNMTGGNLGFGRAFGVGLLIAIVASLCYVATWEVIYFKFMPDFADRYAARTMEEAKSQGKSEAQVAEIQKQMEDFKVQYKNPLVNIAYTLIEPLPVGILFALISAAALTWKRRKPEPALA
jgi:amino acid transporter